MPSSLSLSLLVLAVAVSIREKRVSTSRHNHLKEITNRNARRNLILLNKNQFELPYLKGCLISSWSGENVCAFVYFGFFERVRERKCWSKMKIENQRLLGGRWERLSLSSKLTRKIEHQMRRGWFKGEWSMYALATGLQSTDHQLIPILSALREGVWTSSNHQKLKTSSFCKG